MNVPFQAPSPEYLAGLLPQYDVESFIAQGGMGAVYKGRQISLDRAIAIKVLPREMGESEEFRESFMSEAKAMARLNHTNLLGVFDYGTVEGMPYIVMEYVDGGSLHQAAYNQAVDYGQAVGIVRAICEGLAHAHETGIVHRDIKPSNILLTRKIEPKIADFGLAHAADFDKPGLVMGTPGYTAPEVFHDPDQAGPLADIYSVGVILNQLLTGVDPAGSMEPPTQSSGSLRLDKIWRKATHIDPAMRYPSIVAMIADLDKWIADKKKLDVSAVPAGYKVAPSPVTVHVPSGGEGGIMGNLMIIGLVAVLIVLAFVMFQESGKKVNKPAVGTPGTSTPGTVAPGPVAKTPQKPQEPRKPSLPPGEGVTRPFRPDPRDTSDNDDDDDDSADDADDKPTGVVEAVEKPEPNPEEMQQPGDPVLRERAIGLIADARRKRDKEFSDNASALHFALRRLSAGATAREMKTLEAVKGQIVGNRIPIVDDVHGLPEDMVSAFKGALTKEGVINERYRAELMRIRDAYVSRLKGASDQCTDESLKMRLDRQAAEAEDLDSWVALLSPEPHWVVRRSTVGADQVFAGNWDISIGGRTERWTAHMDGRIEIIGEDGDAAWEIRADDTLEVKRDGRRLFRLTRVDDGWSGTDSSDGRVSLKRGAW